MTPRGAAQVPEEFWRRKYTPTWDPLRVRMEPRADPDDPAAVAAELARRRRGMVPCEPDDAWCTASQVRAAGRAPARPRRRRPVQRGACGFAREGRSG